METSIHNVTEIVYSSDNHNGWLTIEIFTSNGQSLKVTAFKEWLKTTPLKIKKVESIYDYEPKDIWTTKSLPSPRFDDERNKQTA